MIDQRTADVRQFVEAGGLRGYASASVRTAVPRSAAADATAVRAPSTRRWPQRQPRRAPPADVLLAHRDPDVRLVYAAIIERQGYTVRTIGPDDDVLAGVRRSPPSLLIAEIDACGDVALPRALRADLRTREVELLILSADPFPKEFDDFDDEECPRCLAMPVSPGRLVREVRMLIGRPARLPV